MIVRCKYDGELYFAKYYSQFTQDEWKKFGGIHYDGDDIFIVHEDGMLEYMTKEEVELVKWGEG